MIRQYSPDQLEALSPTKLAYVLRHLIEEIDRDIYLLEAKRAKVNKQIDKMDERHEQLVAERNEINARMERLK